jgi:hypothetical protein
MKYYKAQQDRTDPQRLAEMLAMQEANQKVSTDYGALPSMSSGSPNFINPMDLEKMRRTAMNRKAQKIGKNTYDTVTPMNTQGLA